MPGGFTTRVTKENFIKTATARGWIDKSKDQEFNDEEMFKGLYDLATQTTALDNLLIEVMNKDVWTQDARAKGFHKIRNELFYLNSRKIISKEQYDSLKIHTSFLTQDVLDSNYKLVHGKKRPRMDEEEEEEILENTRNKEKIEKAKKLEEEREKERKIAEEAEKKRRLEKEQKERERKEREEAYKKKKEENERKEKAAEEAKESFRKKVEENAFTDDEKKTLISLYKHNANNKAEYNVFLRKIADLKLEGERYPAILKYNALKEYLRQPGVEADLKKYYLYEKMVANWRKSLKEDFDKEVAESFKEMRRNIADKPAGMDFAKEQPLKKIRRTGVNPLAHDQEKIKTALSEKTMKNEARELYKIIKDVDFNLLGYGSPHFDEMLAGIKHLKEFTESREFKMDTEENILKTATKFYSMQKDTIDLINTYITYKQGHVDARRKEDPDKQPHEQPRINAAINALEKAQTFYALGKEAVLKSTRAFYKKKAKNMIKEEEKRLAGENPQDEEIKNSMKKSYLIMKSLDGKNWVPGKDESLQDFLSRAKNMASEENYTPEKLNLSAGDNKALDRLFYAKKGGEFDKVHYPGGEEITAKRIMAVLKKREPAYSAALKKNTDYFAENDIGAIKANATALRNSLLSTTQVERNRLAAERENARRASNPIRMA